MPTTWAGIEDNSPVPNRIWLSREKGTDEWQPLRHVDCKTLNECQDKKLVHIECGRATADPTHGVVFYNFEKRRSRQLRSATWFIMEIAADDAKKIILTPMNNDDAQVTEQLYQTAISAGSSFGIGLDNLVNNKSEAAMDLVAETTDAAAAPSGESYEVRITKRHKDGHYVMKKCQKNTWFGGKTFELQRGYGAYKVDGEEEEMALGPVHHVVFIIHGIGEAMWTREDVMISSLGEQVTNLRRTINKHLYKEWKTKCERLLNQVDEDGEPQQLPKPPNRVEFIPIEWYDHIHSSSSSIMQSLQLTTLSTIPALRAIANDVIFDVLMYLTPDFCYEVLEYVSKQLHEIHQRYQQIHPEFSSSNDGSGGKFSIIGHSLGSVIAWDLLSILKKEREEEEQQQQGEGGVTPMDTTDGADATVIGYQQYAKGEETNKSGSWGPTLPPNKTLSRTSLPFLPDFTIFLGSPIGLFLTLRGAHAVFDELRLNVCQQVNKQGDDNEPPLVSPFVLPSGSLYNIFHPSDPVAYRIEPLLLSSKPDHDNDNHRTTPITLINHNKNAARMMNNDQKYLPPPKYLTRTGEDIRLHVKVREFGDTITKSIANPKASLSFLTKSVTKSSQHLIQSTMAVANQNLGQQPHGMITEAGEEEEIKKKKRRKEYKFPLGGNNNDRIDYQMQPNVIDSEYVSAVMAHNYSSYFENVDIQNIIVDLTTKKQ